MTNEPLKAYRHLELQNQRWLDQRVAWILKEFGLEHINRLECMLPTSARLAEYRGGTDEEVIEYFKKITVDLGLDPENISFTIEDRLETDEGKPALGLYSELEGGRFMIAMEASQLSDPCELAATLAHELCHVHLLGHGRIDSETPDHEPLTDLLCVFMGYGIISANSVIHDRTEGLGAYQERHSGRQGYMSMSMFGYALALLASLRNEEGHNWRRHMRADVRDAFQHSLRFLQRNGLPDLTHVPDEFIEPILSLERTTQPPPTAALAPLYAHSIDPEIPEEETDYAVEQAVLDGKSDQEALASDQSSSTLHEDAECIYCGATSDLSEMVLPAVGESIVCGACRDSIEEGQREAAELTELDGRGSGLVGGMLLIAIACAALIILWSFVSAIWSE